MALVPRHRRSRFRVYVLLITLILIAGYYYGPSSAFTKISLVNTKNQSQDTEENDAAAASKSNANSAINKIGDDGLSLKPEGIPEDGSIYAIAKDPLRIDFDPDQNNAVLPNVISLDKINDALKALGLHPLPEGKSKSSSSSTTTEAAQKESSKKKISPISDSLKRASYSQYNLGGYVGNLDLPQSMNSYREYTCSDINYDPSPENRMEYSQPILIKDDLRKIEYELKDSRYAPLLSIGVKTGQRISNSLYRFSGSSVWLPEYECYLMATRVAYAPTSRSTPVVSFIRLQLFDSNFKELKNKRIRFSDLTKEEVHAVLRDYSDSKDEDLLDKISVKFPKILDIPFDINVNKKSLLGPEDPRILMKNGEYSQEPLIVFNMLENEKRMMYSLFPLRKPNAVTKKINLTQYKIQSFEDTKKSEKNWVPFFDSLRVGDSSNSEGYIHFLYNIDTLIVLKCNLNTGKCEKLQNNMAYSRMATNGQFLRGSTNLIPVPNDIVKSVTRDDSLTRLQMWVGFTKTHLKNCGCGKDLYRPVLSVLIKEDGVFRLEYLSQSIDFNTPVLSWDTTTTNCQNVNSLTANSIAAWDIEPVDTKKQDPKDLPRFNDYMTVTLSEADFNVKTVIMKNVLNHILGIYNRPPSATAKSDANAKNYMMVGGYDDESVVDRSIQVCECMLESAVDYCHNYGMNDLS